MSRFDPNCPLDNFHVFIIMTDWLVIFYPFDQRRSHEQKKKGAEKKDN